MFKSDYEIKIKDFVKNEYAHNPEDGEKIANEILKNYKGDRNIIINFENIKTVNTAFANKIIEALYENYDRNDLNKYFSIKNINELIKMTIINVIENYKEVNINDNDDSK